MLSVKFSYRYVERRYADCRYDECHGAGEVRFNFIQC